MKAYIVHDGIGNIRSIVIQAADLEGELGRDHAIGAAANAVGPEIFAAHLNPHCRSRAVGLGSIRPRRLACDSPPTRYVTVL